MGPMDTGCPCAREPHLTSWAVLWLGAFGIVVGHRLVWHSNKWATPWTPEQMPALAGAGMAAAVMLNWPLANLTDVDRRGTGVGAGSGQQRAERQARPLSHLSATRRHRSIKPCPNRSTVHPVSVAWVSAHRRSRSPHPGERNCAAIGRSEEHTSEL